VGATRVTIWTIDVCRHDAQFLFHLLDERERRIGARFVQDEDRARYIAAHGAMRAILASLTGRRARGLRFDAAPSGKPLLPASGVEFNLSHSGAWAWLATTAGHAVGVDVQRVDVNVPAEPILRQFASPEELARFREVPSNKRTGAFFTWWTRKEAYAKGTGDGLAGDPRDVTVWRGSSSPIRSGAWTVVSPPAPTGYRAALAVRAPEVDWVMCPWVAWSLAETAFEGALCSIA
jgi:4'-phosphopantetheinyl transferase